MIPRPASEQSWYESTAVAWYLSRTICLVQYAVTKIYDKHKWRKLRLFSLPCPPRLWSRCQVRCHFLTSDTCVVASSTLSFSSSTADS